MTLYEKGTASYNYVMKLYESGILSSFKDELYLSDAVNDEVYHSLLVNRLYYSLYQINKSMISSTANMNTKHLHFNNAVKNYCKIINCTVTQKSYMGLMQELDNIKDERHLADYQIICSNFDIDFFVLRCSELYGKLKNIGDPQC